MSVAKGFAVLTVGAVAGVAAGAALMPAERPEVRENRDRIVAMPPAERARLDQKFRAYQALPPATQDRLRTLHEALELDRETKNGLSLSAMNDYIAWIATIPAPRREELSAKADPGERIAAMRTILAERQARKTPEFAEMPGGPQRITRSELANVLEILEEHVRPSLSAEDEATFDGLQSKPTAYRAAFLMTKLSSRLQFSSDLPSLPPPWSQGLLEDLGARMQNPGLRMAVQQMAQQPRGRLRTAAFVNWILLNAVGQDLRRELVTRRVGDSDLESHFLSLGPMEQDKLSRLAADDFRSALRMSFLGKDEAVLRDFRAEFDRFDAVARQMGPFGRRPEGGGGPGRPDGIGRPDGFGPGDRRPGRGDFGPPDGPRGEFRDRDRFRPEERPSSDGGGASGRPEERRREG